MKQEIYFNWKMSWGRYENMRYQIIPVLKVTYKWYITEWVLDFEELIDPEWEKKAPYGFEEVNWVLSLKKWIWSKTDEWLIKLIVDMDRLTLLWKTLDTVKNKMLQSTMFEVEILNTWAEVAWWLDTQTNCTNENWVYTIREAVTEVGFESDAVTLDTNTI